MREAEFTFLTLKQQQHQQQITQKFIILNWKVALVKQPVSYHDGAAQSELYAKLCFFSKLFSIGRFMIICWWWWLRIDE